MNYGQPQGYDPNAMNYGQPMQQNIYVNQGVPVSPAGVLSKFDGTVLETFCAVLVAGLLTGLTFGIAFPWAVCYMWRFVISHVIVDGRRLTFDGTGGQLFGNWILWFILTLITLGIYSFWVMPKMIDWVAKHTHFA